MIKISGESNSLPSKSSDDEPCQIVEKHNNDDLSILN